LYAAVDAKDQASASYSAAATEHERA